MFLLNNALRTCLATAPPAESMIIKKPIRLPTAQSTLCSERRPVFNRCEEKEVSDTHMHDETVTTFHDLAVEVVISF
jgi:hypothetical protein